jgi:AbrB family looped-hinge helix DNA binding protein
MGNRPESRERVYLPTSGKRSGIGLSETRVDAKGRVVIPEDIRRKLKIGEGTRVRIMLEGGDGSTLVIRKSMGHEEFIKLTKGAIKEGSPVKISDPLRLKEIWGGV